MIELVHQFFLYVNKRKLPTIFTTRVEAAEAARAHMQGQAELQIKATWGTVRIWDYDYHLKQWVELGAE